MNEKTFWITKYALTKGIYSQPCRVTPWPNGKSYAHLGLLSAEIGVDAFETESEARANAIEKAKRKLVSMDKARAKLTKRIAEWAEKAQ